VCGGGGGGGFDETCCVFLLFFFKSLSLIFVEKQVREDPMQGVVVGNFKRFAVQFYQDCSDLLGEVKKR